MSREGGKSLFRPCGRLYKVRVFNGSVNPLGRGKLVNKYNRYP